VFNQLQFHTQKRLPLNTYCGKYQTTVILTGCHISSWEHSYF